MAAANSSSERSKQGVSKTGDFFLRYRKIFFPILETFSMNLKTIDVCGFIAFFFRIRIPVFVPCRGRWLCNNLLMTQFCQKCRCHNKAQCRRIVDGAWLCLIWKHGFCHNTPRKISCHEILWEVRMVSRQFSKQCVSYRGKNTQVQERNPLVTAKEAEWRRLMGRISEFVAWEWNE